MPPTTGSFTFINLTVVWYLGGLSDSVQADAQPEVHGREQCSIQQEALPLNITVVWYLGGPSDGVPADA